MISTSPFGTLGLIASLWAEPTKDIYTDMYYWYFIPGPSQEYDSLFIRLIQLKCWYVFKDHIALNLIL